MKDASYADAQRLAERVRETMFATDNASRALGMAVAAISPGHASVTMTVREDMLNGIGICHGGLIATLADTAFAYACNSYNETTVASSFDIELLGPGRLGELLTADARVVSQGARMGVYDVTVSNPSGDRIAVFRGRSYRLKGKQIVAT